MTKTKERITKTDRFNMLIDILAEFAPNETDLITFCENEKEAIAQKAAKNKARAAKEAAKPDALMAEITNCLREADDYLTIADLVALLPEELDGVEVTSHKITARLTKLRNQNAVEKVDVRIPATEDTKSRVCKAYKYIATVD